MAENAGTIYYTVDAKTDQLVQSGREAEKQLDKTVVAMEKTDKSAKELKTTLSGLSKAIGAVIAANALRGLADLVQKYQEYGDRVRMATSSTQEYEAVQRRLLDTANGTYRSLSEAQELYIRTADSLRALGYSTSQAMDVQDSLSYAFVTNATSAERAGAAIDAFSKSITTGKVAADQWETISSAVPTIINQIAAASGKSASEVRALGAAGKLTATQLSEGLRKSLDANAKAAAEMSNNLTDAGVRAKTALTAILVSLENQTGVLDKLTNGIISAADAVLTFGQDAGKMEAFLQTAMVAAAGLASVIAGRLIMGLAESTKAFYASTVGATVKAKADLAAAQAATVLAAEELVQARAAEAAAVGLSTHGAAATRLATAEAAATVATNTLAVAQQRVAASASVAGVAMATLRNTMAFLGGPAGLILLAATALVTFGIRARDAKPQVDALTASINEMNAAQLTVVNLDIDKKIDELSGKLKVLADNYAYASENANDTSKRGRRYADDQKRIAGEISNVSQELEKYAKRRSEVNKLLAGGKPAPAAPEGAPTLTNPNLPGSDPADKAAAAELKKRQREFKQGTLENEKAIGDLSQALAQAQLKAEALAQAQAVMKLNEYATPQQIQQVKDLASAIYQAEQAKTNKALLGQVDPLAGEQQRYEQQLKDYQTLNDAKLLSDQRYVELKGQAEQAHTEKMRQLEEERWAAQATGNQLIMDSLNALQQKGTEAITGLIVGTNSFGDAWRSVAASILQQGVGALVQIGIQQAKNFVMGQAQQAAATGTAAASGAAMAASYAPAAAAASIASFGAAASAGLAAVSSAIPAILGFFGGRAQGGPVQAGGMYRINETGQPEVFQAANGRQYMLPNSRGEVISNRDASRGMASAGGGVTVNLIEDKSRAGTVQSRQGADGQTIVDAVVASIRGDGPVADAVQSKWGLTPVGT